MCSVKEYLQRLKVLGYVVKSNLPEYTYSYNQPEFYESEIEELERQIIACHPIKSLYDVLFMNRTSLTRYCDNKNLKQAFHECGEDFEFVYPYFGGILNMQYLRGRRRKNFKKTIEGYLVNVFGRPVPHICVDRVINYLSDWHLKGICQKF